MILPDRVRKVIFRKEWGDDAREPISKLEVALDAITPGYSDVTIRMLCTGDGQPFVNIRVHRDMYYTGKPIASINITMTALVVDALKQNGYVDSFFGNPDSKIWLVSIKGEEAWAKLIGN